MQYLFEEYGHYEEDEEDKAAAREDGQERRGNEKSQQQPAANAREVNQALEEKRREGTYFRLEELEADFKYFERTIIPELEEEVLTLIGKYLHAQREENARRREE